MILVCVIVSINRVLELSLLLIVENLSQWVKKTSALVTEVESIPWLVSRYLQDTQLWGTGN